MMELPIHAWLTPELAQRFAGSLLHFFWQGAVIAMVAAIALRLLANRSAETRYAVSVVALLLMLAAPVLTFIFYAQTGLATRKLMLLISENIRVSAQSVSQSTITATWTQWIVVVWFIGVFVCAIRLIAGWRISRSLTKVGTSVVPSEIQQSFNEIMERLAMTKPVRLLASLRIDTPVAVGWLRPVVLLPIAALTGLDEDQLRAVFAHELAHIRRHDFLVNMIQRGVESVLFYHPAVWWLSSRIRSERENCCDDIAVEICADRSMYAQALIELERVRTVEPELAVAATGGRLTQRIHRILGYRIVENDWQAAVAALLFVVVWVMVGAWQSDATLDARPFAPPSVPAAASAPVIVKSAAITPKLAGAINAIAAIVTAEPVQLLVEPAFQPEPQQSTVLGARPTPPAPTGVVTGVLRTDNGSPLGEVRVLIPAGEPTAVRSSRVKTTDSTGRYRLENVSPGRYSIQIVRGGQMTYHPGVTELSQATTIEVVAGSTIEVPEMVLRGGGPLTGRVVDMATGKGRGIQKLILCCDYARVNATGEMGVRRTVGTFDATVFSDGSFDFPSVPPGNYFLSIEDTKVIPVSRAVTVGENGLTGLQLDVSEGVDVHGTVLDQNGEPVTASVRLRPSPNPIKSVFNATGSMRSPIDKSENTVIASLIETAGIPSIEDLRDRLSKAERVHSYSPGRDGRFEFQNVYPGAYILEVVAAGGIVAPGREIQVGTNGLTNVSLQVPAFQWTGRIILPNGGPLPKLNYIRIVRSSDMETFYGFPDAEGHFSVLLLVPGEYRVFTEGLWSSVHSVSDGARDITNTEFKLDGSHDPQIVVTLEP